MKQLNPRLRDLPISWDLTLLFEEAFREIETYGRSEPLFLDNYNNTLFSNPIDLSTQGYIFPFLSTPYVYIPNFKGSKLNHIEIQTPILLTKYTPEPTVPKKAVPLPSKGISPKGISSKSPILASGYPGNLVPVKPPGGPKLNHHIPPVPLPSLR
jgi:hypothetical protein